MRSEKVSFLKHITNSENKKLLWLTLGIAVIYFIVLRFIYPLPSYCGDSYTFISTARYDHPVSYRPVLYSRYMNFFHKISVSDIALIAGQYLSNVAANLFLFFTCTWLFTFRRTYKIVLYALLICNPFYLFYSNYITSDPFFNSFAVAWFALLVWMMYKPSWLVIIAQLVILSQLFQIRYNAIIFPAFMWLAVFLGRHSVLKRTVSIAASILLIVVFVYITKKKTYRYAGTETFAAFSGWQLANNALHLIRYEDVDTSEIADTRTKFLIAYSRRFFDTTTQDIPAITSHYMWSHLSPLKQYMNKHEGKSKYFFRTWTALGPVYNNFAKTVILQNPGSYVKHFALPNAKEYFFPKMEIYKNYFEHVDTIGKIAREFYHYAQDKRPAKKQWVYDAVFTPWKYLFPAMNFAFLGLSLVYILRRKYKRQSTIFNHTLINFSALYFANFFFIILLAPTVFRYHIFIVTLAYPIILLLIQSLTSKEKTTHKAEVPI